MIYKTWDPIRGSEDWEDCPDDKEWDNLSESQREILIVDGCYHFVRKVK